VKEKGLYSNFLKLTLYLVKRHGKAVGGFLAAARPDLGAHLTKDT
jgi:hypothetical protein